MKIYLIPQFVILNEDSNNAVVQNKNGINKLTDKGIIGFFNKIDRLHKNKVTEKFIEDFFGISQYESILNFLLTSQLIEEEKNIDFEYKRSVVFTNSSKMYSLMKKVIPKNEYNAKFKLVDTFQSKKFMYEIDKLSNDTLVVLIFSPLDLNEYTWTCDYLRKKEIIYCTAFPYNSNFYFSNIYSYNWKNSCPKCFVSELISSLRSTGKFYSIPTFQTVVDIIYNENIKFEIYDFNNLSMNLEIVKAILELLDSKNINFFSSNYREIDINGASNFDQSVHWELCNCLE